MKVVLVRLAFFGFWVSLWVSIYASHGLELFNATGDTVKFVAVSESDGKRFSFSGIIFNGARNIIPLSCKTLELEAANGNRFTLALSKDNEAGATVGINTYMPYGFSEQRVSLAFLLEKCLTLKPYGLFLEPFKPQD